MEGKQARRDEQPTHLPTEFDESTENTAETGHQSSGKSSLSAFLLHRVACKHHLPLSHPFRLVVCVPITIPLQPLANRNLWQAGKVGIRRGALRPFSEHPLPNRTGYFRIIRLSNRLS